MNGISKFEELQLKLSYEKCLKYNSFNSCKGIYSWIYPHILINPLLPSVTIIVLVSQTFRF